MAVVTTHPSSVAAIHQDRHEQAEELLATLAQTDCPEQRRELEHEVVLLTLDIADHAARRYRGRGMDFEDLRQVARLALVKAVRGYRADRGPCFAAYAVPTVTGELKRHFRDAGWAVRPPRRLQEARLEVARREEELRQDLQREPTRDELAASLGLSLGTLAEAAQAASGFQAASLDGAPGDGLPMELPDDRDDYAQIDLRDALHRALAGLGRRELQILRLRFVEERTQAEIGAVIGVSQMQVSRLLSATLARLRTAMLTADAAA